MLILLETEFFGKNISFDFSALSLDFFIRFDFCFEHYLERCSKHRFHFRIEIETKLPYRNQDKSKWKSKQNSVSM